MINNRQAGRRRGRGGQQQRSSGGNPGRQDTGNRIDNRARGNAAQLLEKYKTLARDAQMQGDRVNVEYYLQFADHYFRVLAETRARFEENGGAPSTRRIQGATLDEDEPDYEDEASAFRSSRAAISSVAARTATASKTGIARTAIVRMGVRTAIAPTTRMAAISKTATRTPHPKTAHPKRAARARVMTTVAVAGQMATPRAAKAVMSGRPMLRAKNAANAVHAATATSVRIA